MSLLYNLHIDNSFYNFYQNTIRQDIISKSCNFEPPFKIMIFGLHSCGNLTSDSIKIFAEKNNQEFKSLIIISCCLHLLREFVPEKAKNSELFIKHLSQVGYDSQGNFLDETLVYDINDENIGYPISNHIKETHKNVFFTRTVRKSAMQSIPENVSKKIDMDIFFYKTRFFRSLFQIFLVHNVPELGTYYGYGDVEYTDEIGDFNKFKSYLQIVYDRLKDN